jgi:hypothetical protein
MNHTSTHSNSAPPARLSRRLAIGTALAGLLACSTALRAQQYYDFDDGTDTGWQTSTLHPNTITYPPDALGGYAWRLQGTPMTSGSDTNARVFAYFTNRFYTNFYAAVDVVSWNTNQDCQQVIALMARANANPLFGNNTFDPDIPNAILFNVLLHDYRSYAGPTNNGPTGASDQMSIWGTRNVGYATLGDPVAVTGTQNPINFRWVPGHAYRLVFSCTNTFGAATNYYTASIYDVNDLTAPLASVTGDDSYPGNHLYIPTYGYVGVAVDKVNNGDYDPSVDATFDNFYVGETAPVTAVVPPAIPHGKWGAPQVINRVPVSYKNFHPAASGITFNATTLTTTNNINTAAIKLYLNGVDVSAGLVISGPTTNASVSYFGLVSNTVYDASIVLQDALGRRTTNQWTFDTFSDAYLADTNVCKTIECEDYDFYGGQFIPDPPASGYANYDVANGTGTYINLGSGYVEQYGYNANGGSPPSDYFDYDTSPQSQEDMYRHSDDVGTQQGNWGSWVSANNTQYYYSQTYDTQRSKYASTNATLQEYVVMKTEGGEWLNYTRIFDGSKNYNAYLRVGCGLTQPVRLDQIVGGVGGMDPTGTNTLGWFNVPSTFFPDLYRYVPLTTTNGALAVVNLSQTNMVRLTMDSERNNNTRDGLSLNYMVFVPAVPQVFSSTQVKGPYTPEMSTIADTGNKRLSVPQSGSTKFYRVSWTSPVTITGISTSGGRVVLTYQ